MILPLFQGFFRRAIGVIFRPAISTKIRKSRCNANCAQTKAQPQPAQTRKDVGFSGEEAGRADTPAFIIKRGFKNKDAVEPHCSETRNIVRYRSPYRLNLNGYFQKKHLQLSFASNLQLYNPYCFLILFTEHEIIV